MRVRWKVKQLRLNMAARLGRDVTQDEVARGTGISVSRLSNIENGKAQGVEFDTIAKLAAFFGVSDIGELLELTDDEGNKKPTAVRRRKLPTTAVGFA